ncbi:hypothetical protein FRC10_000289 [Ceratobasidium sp. 414]|nr:hypothetical protein FRC10_000289 [Ceratobasidium sp. 414]
MLAPSIEACTDSIACVLGITFSAGIPALVLLLAAARGTGAGMPGLANLKEFISYDDIDAADAEETGAGVQLDSPSSPTVELANEYRAFLSNRDGLVTQPDLWRQVSLISLAFLQVVGWATHLLSIATYFNNLAGHKVAVVSTVVTLASWVYAVLRPIVQPSRTPHYDLLTLYCTHLVAACAGILETHGPGSGSIWFNRLVWGSNTSICLAGLIIIVNMPLNAAQNPRREEYTNGAPSLEDCCTLWQWMTFGWVTPIISLGASRLLEEGDVWKLSYSMRTRVLMHKFLRLRGSSLLHRLYIENARDISIDVSLTCLSTLMNFSGPFFLNLILWAMSSEPTSKATAATPVLSNLGFYGSVILGSPFLSGSNRNSFVSEPAAHGATSASRDLRRSDTAQSELQHLYFSRRATIRIDGELVASVYEKILRRKDTSGVTLANEKATKGKGPDYEDTPRPAASNGDIRRIMSLISADAFRLSITFSQGPYVYDAFMSIVITCIMLYNLMGWTTFAGYVVLFLALPFNSLIVYHAAALHRTEAAMRDQCMQAVNEAIQAIRFIKFSAWESRWINRVLDMCRTELQWLRKLKVVYFFINMMWDTVPIFVAAISFSCFTLVARRELTVDIAFPCIAIFGMLSPSLTAVSYGLDISNLNGELTEME